MVDDGTRGGTGRNVTTSNCLIPGRAMRELIGNTGARGCMHGRMLREKGRRMGKRATRTSLSRPTPATRCATPLTERPSTGSSRI